MHWSSQFIERPDPPTLNLCNAVAESKAPNKAASRMIKDYIITRCSFQLLGVRDNV